MTKKNKTTKAAKTTTKVKAFNLSDYPSKSAAIRDLASQQMPRAEIAKTIGIRYQHVRNVLETPLKRPAK